MPSFWRWFRPVVLVMLLVTVIFPLAAYAQDEEESPIKIQGTPELEALVSAIRDEYVALYPSTEVQIDAFGLRGSFEALCAGEADIVMSTEAISNAQIEACGQDFIELVLSYEAVALLPTPEAELTCADQAAVENAWQLGAPDEVAWADLGSATALDTPAAFYGPQDLASVYLLFRSLVPAGDLRENIVRTDDVIAILDKVKEEGSSAFGFMSLADWERVDPDASVAPLEIRTVDGTCVAPSLSTLAARTYPFSRTDYLYVNAASAERSEVRSLLQFALIDEAGITAIAPEQGYTVADSGSYEFGMNNVVGGITGRTFSRPISPVDISTAEAGRVLVAGTAVLNDLTNAIKSDFTSQFPSATVEVSATGNSEGWQKFCSGQADVLQVTRAATEEELAVCTENGIEPYEIDLGTQALILAAPGGNDWLECANGDLISSLLRAGTDDAPAPATWNAINPDWPESNILLVVPPLSSGETDFLTFSLVGDLSFALRQDVLEDNDPLYRAQGVANTDNGFTYLWWTDLQGSDAAIKQLAVDNGADCVAPSLETFADGTYPLAYPVRYYFSPSSFSQPLVRALLWHFFDPTTLDTLAETPYAGLDLTVLCTTQREAVYSLLAEYQAAAAAEEPTEEATPEATVEPTVEPTTVPTEEPTAEPTEEPTVEPTEEPTEEPTDAPTVEPTAEPTATPGS